MSAPPKKKFELAIQKILLKSFPWSSTLFFLLNDLKALFSIEENNFLHDLGKKKKIAILKFDFSSQVTYVFIPGETFVLALAPSILPDN